MLRYINPIFIFYGYERVCGIHERNPSTDYSTIHNLRLRCTDNV